MNIDMMRQLRQDLIDNPKGFDIRYAQHCYACRVHKLFVIGKEVREHLSLDEYQVLGKLLGLTNEQTRELFFLAGSREIVSDYFSSTTAEQRASLINSDPIAYLDRFIAKYEPVEQPDVGPVGDEDPGPDKDEEEPEGADEEEEVPEIELALV